MSVSDVLTSKQIMLIERMLTAVYSKLFYSILNFILKPFFSVVKVADFQKLQEAKEVLCDETKRKNYDLWKRSGVTIPFHDWQALNDSVKTVHNVLSLDS